MSDIHLIDDILAKDIEKVPTRKGFGMGLKKAGEIDERVVGLCADLTESTNMHFFRDAFPERFVEIGVAEQNLVTVASGLAALGKIPFASSYAAFSPGRNWEQIRTTICLNDRPVKIVGAHAGLSVGLDGATHQMLEDMAIMRTLPNMVVIAPLDAVEAEKATLAMAKDKRPNYMRVSREASPVITTPDTPFEIGKAYVFEPGTDVTIIATGLMTYEALVASQRLFKTGVDAEVIHCPTLKPLDSETILKSVRRTGAVVTVEEGQITGGLGGAVAELLSEELPVVMRRVGMKDHFGESGKPDELFQHFGLTAKHIMMAAHIVMDKKR